MNVKSRKIGKIMVLELSGKVTTGEGDVKLARKFRECVEQGERLFVFDMLQVPWLDTGGIAEVVSCDKRIRDRNGIIKLVMAGQAHDLFTMYELHKVFKIFSTLEKALASFAEAATQA